MVKPPKTRFYGNGNGWAAQVRAMKVGDRIKLEQDDVASRNNKHVGARRAFPTAKFSISRDANNVYYITRVR